MPLIHNKILPLSEWKATCCLSKGTTYRLLLYILMQRALGGNLLCNCLSPASNRAGLKKVFCSASRECFFLSRISLLLGAVKGLRRWEYWVAYCQAQKNANKIPAEKSSHSSGGIIADIKLRLGIAVRPNWIKASANSAKKYRLSPRELLSGGMGFVATFWERFTWQTLGQSLVCDQGTPIKRQMWWILKY